MTDTDDLRDRLTDAVFGVRMDYRRLYGEAPSDDIAAALMPVVRKALADAWDDGVRHAESCSGGMTRDPRTSNPWRADDRG